MIKTVRTQFLVIDMWKTVAKSQLTIGRGTEVNTDVLVQINLSCRVECYLQENMFCIMHDIQYVQLRYIFAQGCLLSSGMQKCRCGRIGGSQVFSDDTSLFSSEFECITFLNMQFLKRMNVASHNYSVSEALCVCVPVFSRNDGPCQDRSTVLILLTTLFRFRVRGMAWILFQLGLELGIDQ